MTLPGQGVDLDLDHLLRLRHLAFRMRDAAAMSRSVLPGGIVHRRRGRGLEVHDVRVWSEGDDIRHLDRNATALQECFKSEDHAEVVASFLERLPAKFSGR